MIVALLGGGERVLLLPDACLGLVQSVLQTLYGARLLTGRVAGRLQNPGRGKLVVRHWQKWMREAMSRVTGNVKEGKLGLGKE